MDLQNKVVWLTGASSGIGEALAAAFARNKVKLVLSARREDELKRVAHATGLAEQDYMILPLDLENQSSFEEKKNEVLNRFGRIDILINNGGISQRSLAYETEVSVDRKLMEVNYFGTIALSKSCLLYTSGHTIYHYLNSLTRNAVYAHIAAKYCILPQINVQFVLQGFPQIVGTLGSYSFSIYNLDFINRFLHTAYCILPGNHHIFHILRYGYHFICFFLGCPHGI